MIVSQNIVRVFISTRGRERADGLASLNERTPEVSSRQRTLACPRVRAAAVRVECRQQLGLNLGHHRLDLGGKCPRQILALERVVSQIEQAAAAGAGAAVPGEGGVLAVEVRAAVWVMRADPDVLSEEINSALQSGLSP